MRDGVGKEGMVEEEDGIGEEGSFFTELFLFWDSFLLSAVWRVVRGIASFGSCVNSLNGLYTPERWFSSTMRCLESC